MSVLTRDEFKLKLQEGSKKRGGELLKALPVKDERVETLLQARHGMLN